MSYFNGDESVLSYDENAEQAMQKALTTGGYGTDSATFINGHALIPEDLESTIVNVVAKSKEDCKILNTLKKTPVKSTVHEFNRRTEQGDYKFLSVGEGEGSPDTDQALERAHVDMKYLQTRRSVTKQMEMTDGFENAIASEKLCGVETITKGIENMIFHGDSAIIPTEFDGFVATLNKSKNTNIMDFRGDTIGKRGEEAFDEMARMVWDRAGDLEKAMFPSVLARDIKDLFADRIRFAPTDTMGAMTALPDYPTAIGPNIRFAGANAGADKFFEVKGKVNAVGNVNKRPNAPASVSGSASLDPKAQFTEAEAGGDYIYVVHSVNAYGISEGTASEGVTLSAKGNKITLTIKKPEGGATPTGYIICRTKKGGAKDTAMEMVRVPYAGSSTTYEDLDVELPGTASMLFLPKQSVVDPYTLAQLLPTSTYPLYPKDSAETPFLVMFYGALEVRAPEHCGMIKNIAYKGGLY